MADDNWKERLGIEINYSSEDDDSRQKQEDLSPLSPGVDDVLMNFDHLGTTPPRTRIRNKDKSRREKDASTKPAPRIIYSGRSSSEKNFFSRNNSESFDDEVDNVVDGRKPSYNKRTMQRLRGSERDFKLDQSDIRLPAPPPREDRAESLPPQTPFKIFGLQVESCNRFMSLSSKLVSSRNVRLPQPCSAASADEVAQSRIEFYQTFSLLIKMGNPDRNNPPCPDRDSVYCKRQLSKEEHMWQNELKDLIWLELQAWHADRTPQQQDDFLCEAREAVQPLLLEIINYRFQKRTDPTLSNDSGIHIPETMQSNEEEDHDCCMLSMFCPRCMEQQNNALRDVETLMRRLQAAEALFPSSKAFAAQYPLYMSDKLVGRVKAMCVWYNMTKNHRLKLLILGKQLLSHAEKNQSDATDVLHELSDLLNHNIKCSSSVTSDKDWLKDFYDTQPLLRAASYLEQADKNNLVFRSYLEDVLKTKGLRKALNFLEKLHISMLRKASYTLQKPNLDQKYEKEGECFDEQEMRRYGYWSPESQALGLPSYRAAYLFISHIPLDMIHAYLRLRLETKPEQPSVMSIRQLIQELKEGLRLAVLNRQRYLDNVKTSLWNCTTEIVENFKNRVTAFDASVQSVLEVYLEYLQQWVQMIEQQRVQKNILKEEWSFISGITKHIPGGQAVVGSSFCRMATSMFKINREQFKNQVDKLTESIAHVTEAESAFKQTMFSVCRKLQVVCGDGREKIISVLILSKMLRKDLESDTNESVRSSLCSNIIGDSLSQLKREALSMCECISEIVRQIDEASQVPEDWDESDKDVLQSRIREVLHQFFKFGFEYQKEVCWLVTGGSRSQLAQRLISFAQLWMTFVRTRCERGRGLRPRWANHGLDFIMTVCEPHFTSCISDEEFEELKSNIDDCVSHVIGTAVANGGTSPGTPGSYYRNRGVSPSPSTPRPTRVSRQERGPSTPASPEIRSEATSSNEEKDGTIVETLICPVRKVSRQDKLLVAVKELDRTLEDRLRNDSLIGNIVAVRASSSEQTFVRPRTVTFGWQRGIKIGQGRFGKVYTAVNNETGELMAMKEIALQPNDHRTIRSVATELKIFEGIVHENLVRYYGVEIHREEMLIFMELCTEGTLESLVAATESGLPEACIRRYTLQLTRAVATLHKHSIVHRDIKSANIFLTAEGNCLKLGDFGSAVKIKAHTTVPGELQGFVGTQAYMAPEVFMKSNSDGHGRAVDVWSLGCVLIEMGSGKRPWAEYDSNYQIMFKVGMGETPEIPDSLSEEGQHFAAKCLVHDPKQRATITELLVHTFLAVEGDDEFISSTVPSILEDYLKLGIKR
ncbi:mitogen-activated protein kinase kinase kinase 4 isoform X3 [Homalodisca vitripennis]|uniref:mitogen-activated protein kinase kinase kinase 4 isoform X3 n=1 Tax=Homalodisca vitripennis TaxID=197043 RepID=UPI001EEAF467|nr:mitogen-activated protein kinase kinase kinase 4 isoform X3 [Homalodisca vitripennis]